MFARRSRGVWWRGAACRALFYCVSSSRGRCSPRTPMPTHSPHPFANQTEPPVRSHRWVTAVRSLLMRTGTRIRRSLDQASLPTVSADRTEPRLARSLRLERQLRRINSRLRLCSRYSRKAWLSRSRAHLPPRPLRDASAHPVGGRGTEPRDGKPPHWDDS